jgi:hypothetical protein
MSNLKRATGTSAKIRRGAGWGGKGSSHPAADIAASKWAVRNGWRAASPVRRTEPYQSRRGRHTTRWVKISKAMGLRSTIERRPAQPHQGARECARRAAA